jgi:hypothetical protein
VALSIAVAAWVTRSCAASASLSVKGLPTERLLRHCRMPMGRPAAVSRMGHVSSACGGRPACECSCVSACVKTSREQRVRRRDAAAQQPHGPMLARCITHQLSFPGSVQSANSYATTVQSNDNTY